VHPLPAHERILRAVDGLGFRFKSADLEQGHIRGIDQRLPFYQEIEFWAAPQYAHAFNALEVTFVTNPAGIDVILEVDKRGGHDAYHHLRAAHADAQTDWARVIDGWLQQEVLSRASHRLGGHGFAGHHGHSGHHRHGVGTGAIVGGVAAGLVGGYVAGEVMDEVFDDGGFFEE
jgi:sporulation-control protein